MSDSATAATGGEGLVRAAVLLRERNPGALARAVEEMASSPLAQRSYFNRDQFAERFGSPPALIDRLERFASDHGLSTLAVHPGGRLLVLSGPPAAFSRALDLGTQKVRAAGQRFDRLLTEAQLPKPLAQMAEALFPLDDRPLFGREPCGEQAAAHASERSVAGAESTSMVAQVSSGYRFPASFDGSGQRIGIVLLGGGFYREDMKAYFGDRLPEIKVVELAGARNQPAPRANVNAYLDALSSGGSYPGSEAEVAQIWWTIEATIDIQLAGSFAPGARLVVYFAPNTSHGKLAAISAALADKQDAPSVLSCSWGMREDEADDSYVEAMEHCFQMAALRGITICYSSGDTGADVGPDGKPRVHYPASSPLVLSCGGTALPLPAADPATQKVWNESRGTRVLASGGGFSRRFPHPSWQRLSPRETTGRGVPDVSGKADYAHGYHCALVGRTVLGGGTSAAVPMWAGLIARLNQAVGKPVGWLTPLLYQLRNPDSLHDILEGGNGYHDATHGWDSCTGLGSPCGEDLLAALCGAQ
jgi:kumamolisin